MVPGMARKTRTNPKRKWAPNGRRFADQRRKIRLTQERLAETAGVSADLVRQIEGGTIGLTRYDRRKALAKALRMSLERFNVMWDGVAVSESHGEDNPPCGSEMQAERASTHTEAGVS